MGRWREVGVVVGLLGTMGGAGIGAPFPALLLMLVVLLVSGIALVHFPAEPTGRDDANPPR